jgi:hypothetical protein
MWFMVAETGMVPVLIQSHNWDWNGFDSKVFAGKEKKKEFEKADMKVCTNSMNFFIEIWMGASG